MKRKLNYVYLRIVNLLSRAPKSGVTNQERDEAIKVIIRTIVKAHQALIEEREKRKTQNKSNRSAPPPGHHRHLYCP
jgi:hypothetical protein